MTCHRDLERFVIDSSERSAEQTTEDLVRLLDKGSYAFPNGEDGDE